MFLKQIDISGFRGIRQLSLELGQTTVLIGENNTGKSTILDALQLALGRTATRDRIGFTEHDHYLSGDSKQAADGDTIEIVLRFAEQFDGEWPDDIVQQLRDVIQYDENGRQSAILRVQSKYDEDANETKPEWGFLDLRMQQLPASSSKYKTPLQGLVPLFSLKSIRDAKQEFRPGSPLWGPFVRSTGMPPDVRRSLEKEIVDLNHKIVDAHGSFSAVREHLEKISRLVLLADSDIVNIEALSGSVHDVLSRTRMYMASVTGANIPIELHGEGTRSLSIICLLIAFLHSNLRGEYPETATPILTLEEPEAHLHPSAAHSVMGLLQNPSGQSIITTHSGDLVSNIDLSSLLRLDRKDSNIIAYRVDKGSFKPKEVHDIEHHIKTTRGNTLFARCWLLVEGKTDRLVLERCANANGTDLVHTGIYCIEYAHMGSPRALIRFAKQIGIEWFVVADGDDRGKGYISDAQKELGDEDSESHICGLVNTLDVLLCVEGYGHHYENICRSLPHHTSDKDVEYWRAVISKADKTRAAMSVADEICGADGKGTPDTIRRIIDKSVHLAKRSQW